MAFVFLGLGMVLIQLIVEGATIAYWVRHHKTLRRLCYLGTGEFVELPRLNEKDFAHLPGLEPSPCYHLFLSRKPIAIPTRQDSSMTL